MVRIRGLVWRWAPVVVSRVLKLKLLLLSCDISEHRLLRILRLLSRLRDHLDYIRKQLPHAGLRGCGDLGKTARNTLFKLSYERRLRKILIFRKFLTAFGYQPAPCHRRAKPICDPAVLAEQERAGARNLIKPPLGG